MNRATTSSLIGMTAITAIAAAWPFGVGAAPAHRMPTRTEASCCSLNDSAVAVKHTLTLKGANLVLASALAKARERHAGGAIAVVDDGGSLLAFGRIDGTFAAGASVSIGKARTAALFNKPTKAFEDSLNGGRFALAAVGELTPLQGGVPIMHEGFVVGAIGVSGAHSQAEDEEIAIAGASAIAKSPSASK